MMPWYHWVVTHDPGDHPGGYVVRAHEIGAGRVTATSRHHVADTLDEVRRHIPPGLYRFARDPNDDPVIVETWL